MSHVTWVTFRSLWQSVQRSARQLAGRQSLSVAVRTGRGVPLPPEYRVTGRLEQLEAWIDRHAQPPETYRATLDRLALPTAAPHALAVLWQRLQGFYRYSLKLFNRPPAQAATDRHKENGNGHV